LFLLNVFGVYIGTKTTDYFNGLCECSTLHAALYNVKNESYDYNVSVNRKNFTVQELRVKNKR